MSARRALAQTQNGPGTMNAETVRGTCVPDYLLNSVCPEIAGLSRRDRIGRAHWSAGDFHRRVGGGTQEARGRGVRGRGASCERFGIRTRPGCSAVGYRLAQLGVGIHVLDVGREVTAMRSCRHQGAMRGFGYARIAIESTCMELDFEHSRSRVVSHRPQIR